MSIKPLQKQTLRGDTLVEVMFAIGIFALVAISIATLMNSMLGKSQSAIEVVMARSEIDAQAEALRYIQNSRDDEVMTAVWTMIDSVALIQHSGGEDVSSQIFNENVTACPDLSSNPHAFYIDTFSLGNKINSLDPNMATAEYVAASIFKTSSSIRSASTFPRVLHQSEDDIFRENFGEIGGTAAEGIWVIVIKDENEEYYDFYIQTCWNSLDNPVPNTTSTIVRLKNPQKVSSCRVSFVDEGGANIKSYNSITDGFACNSLITGHTPTAYKDGRVFTHWKNKDTNAILNVGQPFRMPTSGKTDVWEAVFENPEAAKCKVVFKKKGGATSIPGTDLEIVCNGGTFVFPAAPTETGYQFKEWSLHSINPEDNDNNLDNGDTMSGGSGTLSSEKTATYIWKATYDPICKVEFYSTGTKVSSSEIVGCKSSVSAPSGPSRGGRTFVNWLRSGTTDTVNAGGSISVDSTTPQTIRYDAQYRDITYQWNTSVHIKNDLSVFSKSFSGELTCSSPAATVESISRTFSPTITFSAGGGQYSYSGSNHPYNATITLNCLDDRVTFTTSGT